MNLFKIARYLTEAQHTVPFVRAILKRFIAENHICISPIRQEVCELLNDIIRFNAIDPFPMYLPAPIQKFKKSEISKSDDFFIRGISGPPG